MQFEAGKPVIIDIIFANSGSTPALNAIYRGGKKEFNSPATFNRAMTLNDLEPISELRTEPQAVIGPGLEATVQFWVAPINQEVFDSVRSQRTWLHLYGAFFYDDVFGRPHYSIYCALFDGHHTRLRACGAGMDNNPNQ